MKNTTIAHIGPVMRCKMRVESVKQVKKHDGSTESEEVQLRAVYEGSEENKKWSKWTPSASFMVTINNPEAFNKLSSGHEYYVDFSPVVKECCGKTQCCKE